MNKNVDEIIQEMDEKKELNKNLTDDDFVDSITKKSLFKLLLKQFIATIIVLFFILTFVVSSYIIPTGSMENTLLVGDMLIVNKFIYGIRTPDWVGIPFTEIGIKIPFYKSSTLFDIELGDVVVFKPPHNEDVFYVKRCVGLPGQTIEVIDKELYVDGEIFSDFYATLDYDENYKAGKVSEKFVLGRNLNRIKPKGFPETGIFRGLGNSDNFGPVTIPDDHYFMMGDNRDNSLDSRYWGFVEKDYIIGSPIMVYYSYEGQFSFKDFFDITRWNRVGYLIQ